MVSSCSAINCTNRQDQNRPDRLFTIPKDRKLNKAWKDNIRRAGELPKDNHIVLCSKHFTSDCFERDLKTEFLSNSTIHVFKIKKDAIPIYQFL